MKTFLQWLAVVESTAFKRMRRNAAMLPNQPTLPDASINSYSTAPENIKNAIVKRNKKGKRKTKKKK